MTRCVLVQVFVREFGSLLLTSPPPLVVVTMFRGFIPGKRVASVDLSAARDEGKENRDPSRVAVGKADNVKNNTKSEGKDSNEMVQAFDKLLVCLIQLYSMLIFNSID